MSTETAQPSVPGDVGEWLCHRCNVIHPHKRGERFTAPCPDCGTAMPPTSPNLREIERLRAQLAEVRTFAVKLRQSPLFYERANSGTLLAIVGEQ